MTKMRCAVCGTANGHKLSCRLFRQAVRDVVDAPTIEQIAKVAQYTGMSALEVTDVAARNPKTFAITLTSIERNESREGCSPMISGTA